MSIIPPSADTAQHFKLIPEVPDFNPAAIGGNVSDDFKRLVAKIYVHFAGKHRKTAFAPQVANQTKFAEVSVHGVEGGKAVGKAWAESVHEVVVTSEMCNSYGTLHGACAALFLELCTSSALVTLGIALGVDGTGVSQTVNYVYHQPARLGRKLRLVGTTISVSGRVRIARGEIWDGDTLCVSCSHSTVHVDNKLAQKRRGKL
ncbi:hypothetical protein APHAL10511_001527 [Amanita phalloides]|nr:hypothetical protein APHAL10511_001527 [Amanita phalloides]